MPTNTPNLNLVKPLVTENYDIAKVTNDNADIIDDAIHDLDLDKQDKLVSGTNIKTINGNPILGSGNLVIATSSDWNLISATLTYTSADSPTFAANTSVDLTSLISVGMKLKLTQTTVKYFIVTAITSTTISLYSNGSTLINSAISNVYYSSSDSPFGFPNTFNEGAYNSIDASGAGLTFTYVQQGTFSKNKKIVMFKFDITWPTNANSSPASISFPIPTAGSYAGVVGYHTVNAPVLMYGSNFYDNTGTGYTNAQLSGKRIAGTITYIATY